MEIKLGFEAESNEDAKRIAGRIFEGIKTKNVLILSLVDNQDLKAIYFNDGNKLEPILKNEH